LTAAKSGGCAPVRQIASSASPVAPPPRHRAVAPPPSRPRWPPSSRLPRRRASAARISTPRVRINQAGWMIILLPFMMLELEKKMLAIEKKRLQMDAEKKEKAGRALTGEAAGTPEKGSEREQGEQRPVTAEQGHAEPSRGGAGAGARPAEQGQRRRRGTRRTP
ncbi:hypothetical protein EJB05_35692, partial [Eragrostis curvula]